MTRSGHPGRAQSQHRLRRWLTEGDAATLHELAAEYGVSAERIRQIEAKAMQKMRTQLAALA
jgi:RNA polymerase sigma-32 factor